MAADAATRTHSWAVRLTAEELQILADLAERLGVSRSDIVRLAIRGQLPDDSAK